MSEFTREDLRMGDTVALADGSKIVVDSVCTSYGDVHGEHPGPWVIAKGPHTFHPLAEVSAIVKRNERLCRFCGDGVTSTNPFLDYCRHCYYSGRAFSESHDELLSLLRAEDGVKSAEIWHTGGGCFCLALRIADGRLVVVTERDANLPDPGQAWGTVGVYESEQVWDEYEDDKVTYHEFFDADGEPNLWPSDLVKFVRQQVDTGRR